MKNSKQEKLVNIFEIDITEHINWQINWNKIENQREGKLVIQPNKSKFSDSAFTFAEKIFSF